MTAVVTDHRYCTFWVDGLYFGVDVRDVQEVLRVSEMSAAPRSPGAVRGLLNLRGQIVTAVDLRHRLRLADEAGSQQTNVVVRSRGEIVSLLVDDIGDVIDTAGFAMETAPATLPAVVRDSLVGVIPLNDHILLVLDADRAGDVTEAKPLGGEQ